MSTDLPVMTLDVFTDDVFGGNQLAGNAVANGMDWSAPLHAITQVLAEIFGLQARRI